MPGEEPLFTFGLSKTHSRTSANIQRIICIPGPISAGKNTDIIDHIHIPSSDTLLFSFHIKDTRSSSQCMPTIALASSLTGATARRTVVVIQLHMLSASIFLLPYPQLRLMVFPFMMPQSRGPLPFRRTQDTLWGAMSSSCHG